MNSNKNKNKKQTLQKEEPAEISQISENNLQKELEKYLKLTESELKIQNKREEHIKQTKRNYDDKFDEFKKIKEKRESDLIYNFLIEEVIKINI